MNSRALSHIAALGIMSVWGVTFVSTKVLLDYLSPLEILVLRTALGFAALCCVRPHILRTQKPAHELLFAAAGLTGPLLYYLGENTALEYADASVISVVSSTAPLFTAALGLIILKERGTSPRFVIGFAIAMAGIALISFTGGPAHAHPVGIALCLAGALSWGFYSIAVRRIAELGYETVDATKRIFAWGFAYMLVIWLIGGASIPHEALAQPIVWANLAFLGLLASAACFVAWSYTVKHLGPALASAYIYLQSPIAVIWAAVLLVEPVTPAMVAGIALVIAGLALSEDFAGKLRRSRV